MHASTSISLMLSVVALFMGCTKENTDDCPDLSTHMLMVKAYHTDGSDITDSGDVDHAQLYLFDENGGFISEQAVDMGSVVELNYPDNENISAVVMGNHYSDSHSLPSFEVGDLLSESSLGLVEATKADGDNLSTPEDLFHGMSDITITNDNEVSEVAIGRVTASVSIVVDGLQRLANTTSEDFSFVLRGAKSNLSFDGTTTGDDIVHEISATMSGDDSFESPIFYILAETGQNIEVDIYNGSSLLTTILKDSNGDEIYAQSGELLNIYAKFDGAISVTVSITSWGEKTIYKQL